MTAWPRRTLPGLVAATAVGGVAIGVTQLIPPTVGAAFIAVVTGLLVANTVALPARLGPGLRFATGSVLRAGVVLLGARFTLSDVASIGGPAVLVVLLCMTVVFASVLLLSKVVGVPARLATLIGVGTAVCGNSAIMATSPVVNAKGREISFAVATITIFGTIALLVFPVVAVLADLPDAVFGFWVGLSINDTSQVVAAGASLSDDALEVAIVVKLVRNTFMAPLIVVIAWWTARVAVRRSVSSAAEIRSSALAAFPLFVLGFAALVGARSAGIISDVVADGLSTASMLLIIIAIAAVGLGTRVHDLRHIGMRPFLVGFGASVALAGVGFLLATRLAD